MPCHHQRKPGKPICFFLYRFTWTFALLPLFLQFHPSQQKLVKGYKKLLSVLIQRFLFVITFLWKGKILLGRPKVLAKLKQRARFLAGRGSSYGDRIWGCTSTRAHGVKADTYFSIFCWAIGSVLWPRPETGLYQPNCFGSKPSFKTANLPDCYTS